MLPEITLSDSSVNLWLTSKLDVVNGVPNEALINHGAGITWVCASSIIHISKLVSQLLRVLVYSFEGNWVRAVEYLVRFGWLLVPNLIKSDIWSVIIATIKTTVELP